MKTSLSKQLFPGQLYRFRAIPSMPNPLVWKSEKREQILGSLGHDDCVLIIDTKDFNQPGFGITVLVNGKVGWMCVGRNYRLVSSRMVLL